MLLTYLPMALQFLQGCWALMKSLVRCSHLQTPWMEGKFVCQGCGQGLVGQWVHLRCQGCQTKRLGRYQLGQVVAQTPWCAECGTWEVFLECLETPSFFQLRDAMVWIQEERVFQQQCRWKEAIQGWCQESSRLKGYLVGSH